MDQTWDETTPADTDLISNGDDEIRNFKKAIRERLDVEHVFTSGNEANVGEHATGFITEAKGYIGALAVTNENIKSATAAPTADSIPIADGSGKLDSWITNAAPTVVGTGTIVFSNIGDIAAHASAYATGALTGAVFGDFFLVGLSAYPDVLLVQAKLVSAGIVEVRIYNPTSTLVNFGALTVTVKALRW